MSICIRRQGQNYDSQLSFKALHQIICSLYKPVTTTDRTNAGRFKLIKYLGFSLNPLSFYLNSHFYCVLFFLGLPVKSFKINYL